MVRKKKEAPVEVPEVIPADEVVVAPSEKVKPKRTMTPEMLEKLAIARKKALEVKRKLKDNDEEKIKHIQTRMLKAKEKKEKKENLVKLAEEGLKKKESPPPTPSPPPPAPQSDGLEIPKMVLSVDDKPKPKPNQVDLKDVPLLGHQLPPEGAKTPVQQEDYRPKGRFIDLHSTDVLDKMVQEYDLKDRVDRETDKRLRKLNKKYVVDSDSSDDEPQQQVVYIKRKEKMRPPQRQLGITYNQKTKEAIPPSLIQARELQNRYRM